jgi:hypothetical protein
MRYAGLFFSFWTDIVADVVAVLDASGTIRGKSMAFSG